MPFRAETARGYVGGLVGTWVEELSLRSPAASPAPVAPVETRFRYNQAFLSAHAIVPGVIMMMLALIPAMVAAVGVVREKESGAILNFRSTPVTALEFLGGKAVPYVAVSFGAFLLMLVVAATVFGVPMRGSVAALVLGGLLYVAGTTGFGLIVSGFTHSQTAAIFAAIILSLLPAVNFSGFLVPLSSLSEVGRAIGHAFPSSFFQPLVIGATTKALDFTALWPNLVALAAFAAGFLALACLVLRKREA
jgi:ribosome-dependent ATPase